MQAVRPVPSAFQWFLTQLQHTPRRGQDVLEHTQKSAFRTPLVAHVLMGSTLKLTVVRAVRMHAVALPYPTWACMHSQQMPLLAQSLLVQGHISRLIRWLAHASGLVGIKGLLLAESGLRRTPYK
jgi:hypothetical protein